MSKRTSNLAYPPQSVHEAILLQNSIPGQSTNNSTHRVLNLMTGPCVNLSWQRFARNPETRFHSHVWTHHRPKIVFLYASGCVCIFTRGPTTSFFIVFLLLCSVLQHVEFTPRRGADARSRICDSACNNADDSKSARLQLVDLGSDSFHTR